MYYEKFYFTPGDLGFTVARTKYACLGVGVVCWDQWYPEAARLFALAGVRILLYPTAIGWHPAEREELVKTQHSSWETSMRAHAIANGVYVGAANRVGLEGNLQFWGASFVADPSGDVMHRASYEEEELVIVPCDLARIDATRTTGLSSAIDASTLTATLQNVTSKSLSGTQSELDSRTAARPRSDDELRAAEQCSVANRPTAARYRTTSTTIYPSTTSPTARSRNVTTVLTCKQPRT